MVMLMLLSKIKMSSVTKKKRFEGAVFVNLVVWNEKRKFLTRNSVLKAVK